MFIEMIVVIEMFFIVQV